MALEDHPDTWTPGDAAEALGIALSALVFAYEHTGCCTAVALAKAVQVMRFLADDAAYRSMSLAHEPQPPAPQKGPTN